MRFESFLILGLISLAGLLPHFPLVIITTPERVIIQERIVILREEPEGYIEKIAQPRTEYANPVGIGEVLGIWRITGYFPGDGNTPTHGVVAQGWRDGTLRKVWPGVDAACPYSLPLGSFVWISGVGVRVCSDRGRFCEQCIDVAVRNREEAYQITGTRKVVRIK